MFLHLVVLCRGNFSGAHVGLRVLCAKVVFRATVVPIVAVGPVGLRCELVLVLGFVVSIVSSTPYLLKI